MSRRQFQLSILGIIAIVFIVGPISYFSYQRTVVEKSQEVEKARIEAAAIVEKETVKQTKATERTKERMDWLQRFPFLKDKGE